jgi:hypothetical protein
VTVPTAGFFGPSGQQAGPLSGGVGLGCIEGLEVPVGNDVAFAAGLVSMDNVGPYLRWGVVQISVANFVVIVLMLVVFAAALVLPFPGARK